MEEYVEEKNDPVLTLCACNNGRIERQNTEKDINIDLNIDFIFNMIATIYIDKGAIINKILPGRIDKENPKIEVINTISNKGIFRYLFKELIDLIAIEAIITAIKQLGAIESLLVEKVLVIYKLPKDDKAKDRLVNGFSDIFSLAKNKEEIVVNDNIHNSFRALFS
tara:strand:- start:212 stop:709 length:498 start_codon:yes stop_codon:yes gene_type:complete